jgi:putative SOS response-associated peptidase YedK
LGEEARSTDALKALLRPYAGIDMIAYQVSPRVNKAVFDDAAALERHQDTPRLL